MHLISRYDLPASHVVGPMTHSEQEAPGIECGTDQFGDNVHGKKEGIRYQIN